MTIRVTDYMDVQGRLRTHYGPPQMAYAKIGQLIGRRMVSAERYEAKSKRPHARTWGEARDAYNIEVPST